MNKKLNKARKPWEQIIIIFLITKWKLRKLIAVQNVNTLFGVLWKWKEMIRNQNKYASATVAQRHLSSNSSTSHVSFLIGGFGMVRDF